MSSVPVEVYPAFIAKWRNEFVPPASGVDSHVKSYVENGQVAIMPC
jgi:hypothetical protein